MAEQPKRAKSANVVRTEPLSRSKENARQKRETKTRAPVPQLFIYYTQLQGVHEKRARIVNAVFVYKMYTHSIHVYWAYTVKSDGNRPN